MAQIKSHKITYGYGIKFANNAMWEVYCDLQDNPIARFNTFEQAKDYVDKTMCLLFAFDFCPN